MAEQKAEPMATPVPVRRAICATDVAMDTVVSVEVVTTGDQAIAGTAARRALAWFQLVEQACSRFDAGSELRQLLGQVGIPVPVSVALFEAVRFAVALAERTRGAFDPTIGHVLEALGFDRHYVTGERVSTPMMAGSTTGTNSRRPTFRDVQLDGAARTITLRRPLALDLGAVAKGLAIDLAARELTAFDGYCVDAGGDLFAGGTTVDQRPWRIGVQHPRRPVDVVYHLELNNQAACTSGDYARRTEDDAAHHLVDPRGGRPADALASVTVLAPSALVADGLATAAFILGPARGARLLRREGVDGVFIGPAGSIQVIGGLKPALHPAGGAGWPGARALCPR